MGRVIFAPFLLTIPRRKILGFDLWAMLSSWLDSRNLTLYVHISDLVLFGGKKLKMTPSIYFSAATTCLRHCKNRNPLTF